MAAFHTIKVLDSHTGGETTRLVLEGGPDLGGGPLADRVKAFQENHDKFRGAIVGEPRGSEVGVGAMLVEPHDPSCQFGVIFFNNSGYLGMCGHGVIGTVVSLAHLGRVKPGPVRLDTPAGPISTVLTAAGEVSFENVPSYRREKDLSLYLSGIGDVKVDVAFGGTWYCLVGEHDQRLELNNLAHLTDYCGRIRQALAESGFPEVKHVQLFGPGTKPGAHSRSFILTAGNTYNRSPCGTGTSSRLACLAADGKLAAGVEWVQESIVGSLFKAKYRPQGDKIVPTITGTAHVMREGSLLLDASDPFAWGIK